MKWFRNRMVAQKIMILVSFMATFMGLVGFVGYYFNDEANSNENDLYMNHVMPLKFLNDIAVQIQMGETSTLELILAHNTEEQQLNSKITEASNQFEKIITENARMASDTDEADQLATLNSEWINYKGERQKAVDLLRGGDKLAAYQYYTDNAKSHLSQIHNTITNLSQNNANEAQQVIKNDNGKFSKAIITIVFVTLLGTILAVVFGIFLAKAIATPLKTMLTCVKDVASGNLAITFPHMKATDEVGGLGTAFETMVKNVVNLVEDIQDLADQVAASSEELTAISKQSVQASAQIASAIAVVANGTEKQTIAIRASATVIEQLSTRVQQVAQNSNTVSTLMGKTADTTAEGQNAVTKAVSQMMNIHSAARNVKDAIERLEESSKQIGEIIKLISSIASQTNLLALNAAIEAARAGEQGRGFAVVAEEVKKLAEQSQGAAKQIASLIHDNQKNIDAAVMAMQTESSDVDLGIDVVNAAGQSFGEISFAISEVLAKVQEISGAIEQVADGSNQVVISIGEVDVISMETSEQSQTVSATVKEQSASLEEIAASGHSLDTMTQKLQQAVSKFIVR